MTPPTDLQIEAAAKAIRARFLCTIDGQREMRTWEQLPPRVRRMYLEEAECALKAALNAQA
jgi:hypothetical protein